MFKGFDIKRKGREGGGRDGRREQNASYVTKQAIIIRYFSIVGDVYTS